MAVVALGTFRERELAGSQHPACTISRHISELPSGLPGSQPTPPVGPGKALGRDGEEKWSGAKAGHQGPGELAGSVWYRPRRLLPRVRGAFQSREPRGCYALTRCTYPAWVVPSAGARVPGIRHGAVRRLCLRPACLLLRPSARSRPGAHHAARRGTPLVATHPDRPAPPRAPPAPCCLRAVSAPLGTHGQAMTQDPRRVYIRTLLPLGLVAHSDLHAQLGEFFPSSSYCAILWNVCYLHPVVG